MKTRGFFIPLAAVLASIAIATVSNTALGDGNCPPGSHWGAITPGSRAYAERALQSMLISCSGSNEELNTVDTILNNSSLDERTLNQLSKNINKYFEKTEAKNGHQALKSRIEKAIKEAQEYHGKRAEMFMCIPDDREKSRLNIDGVATLATGQATDEAGRAETYSADKVRVQYQGMIVDTPRFSDDVRMSVTASPNGITIPIEGSHQYTKPLTIEKGMLPSGDSSNPTLQDPKAPFTDGLRPGTLPLLQFTAQDILKIGADGQHQITLSFGEGAQTSASATYKHDETTIQYKAFSGSSASKTDILPDKHTINSTQVLVNQGIGEHFEVGGAFTDQHVPGVKGDTISKSLTGWIKTEHAVGRGTLVTRSVVSNQNTPATDQNALGVVEDVIYSLRKNHFMGEVVIQQESPAILSIKIKNATEAVRLELVKEFTVGYERDLYRGDSAHILLGGSYTYQDTPANFSDVSPSLWEGHMTMEFNWRDIRAHRKYQDNR